MNLKEKLQTKVEFPSSETRVTTLTGEIRAPALTIGVSKLQILTS